MGLTRRSGLTMFDYFWTSVEADSDEGCWPRTVNKGQDYSRIKINGMIVYAHRYAYEQLVGPIPTSKQLDHTCHIATECTVWADCPHRACVNPRHLEPVSCRTNLLRGNTFQASNAAKTHCPAGHEYNAENTYVQPNGGRGCRQCARVRDRRPDVVAHRHANGQVLTVSGLTRQQLANRRAYNKRRAAA